MPGSPLRPQQEVFMALKQVFLVSTMIVALAGGYAQAQQSAVSNQRVTQDQADGQGTQIYVSSAGVRQIQQSLTQKGYSTGAVDGRWNPQTAAAARSFQQAQNNDTTIAATHFQQAQGLEPTGTLTTNLLATVGMSRWERGELMGDMTAGANTPGNPNPQTTGSFNGSGSSTSGGADSNSAKSDASAGQGSGDARAASGSR
ncbi:peptidoglycan-binding protein [Methylobacterium sp. E-005]|uniref:peptidoglycan-binding domain-containing protein n=1 Tax=Methylobacterium sp. E-005 TaxID=2836549 RepID=UPI001FB8C837|nr:peptidoglycan-binding domain-containing protein [Methylobacterium sp. E-005]MCJ2087170.1 peptidoglycan-binding protein [Methylobacterium sp. E-005]